MLNPVFDNKYQRKDVTFEFAEDYSKVKITKDGVTIEIDGNAFADVCAVMEASWQADGKKLASERLFNMTRTTLSCPECSWDDFKPKNRSGPKQDVQPSGGEDASDTDPNAANGP